MRTRVDMQNLSGDVAGFREVENGIHNVGDLGYRAHWGEAFEIVGGATRVH